MARWRLTASHYLNVPGVKYTREETDRDTGEVAKFDYDVPMFLDIRNPPRRYNQDGNIFVTNVKPIGPSRDVYFLGDPTPDMEPVDDEAREISGKMRWQNPMGEEAFPTSGGSYGGSEGFGAAMIAQLEKAIDKLAKKAASGEPTSGKGVDPEAFAELQKQVQALVEQNAKLQNELVDKKVAAGGRR